MKQRFWLIAAAVLVFVVIGALAIRLSSNKGDVSIVNEANQAIRSGQLEVCNQQFAFGPLGSKQTKRLHYKAKSDSHYDVRIEFASGKTLTRQVGYVTSGTDFHDTLTVKEDDVSLTSRD